MYLEKPLQNYLDDLASAQPTPGGGAASALSGAMAAGLACMVARLTQGKADYSEVQAEIETLLQQAEKLRARFQQLIQEDIDTYGQLSASFKMPRGTGEERAARRNAIQARLADAAQVPLTLVECVAELVQCCHRIASIGNANVLSDIAVSATLASSAATGASWMVRINVQSLKDTALASQLDERLQKALQAIALQSQQVIEKVEERTA